ncbi:hypothetical protein HU200_067009 [Digitaria exilis]|uniref:Uncharacterized protein n=1 Tax=Digitaria exilis TaxID=1010633 RepID=A0A835A062_9POAL|nr:hypothetical protein HU200_067009 [Digitaria exilis]
MITASEAMKTDSTYNMKSNSDAAPIKQGSNGSSNNNDMGSTTKNVVTKPATNKERVMSPSAIKANAHTSAFHPVQNWTVPANAAGKAKADEIATIQPRMVTLAKCRATSCNTLVQSFTSIMSVAGERGPGGGNGSGSGSGNDTYVKRLDPAMTPRQAQLIKYREKKKDRNFGKKHYCTGWLAYGGPAAGASDSSSDGNSLCGADRGINNFGAMLSDAEALSVSSRGTARSLSELSSSSKASPRKLDHRVTSRLSGKLSVRVSPVVESSRGVRGGIRAELPWPRRPCGGSRAGLHAELAWPPRPLETPAPMETSTLGSPGGARDA